MSHDSNGSRRHAGVYPRHYLMYSCDHKRRSEGPMNDESAQLDSGARERLLLRFRILDTDGNGYLDAADFERLADNVLDAVGEPRESAKGRAVIDGHRRFWAGLR